MTTKPNGITPEEIASIRERAEKAMKRDLHANERDLRADLAICNEFNNIFIPDGSYTKRDVWSFAMLARIGWPHAIERALDAEALLESHGPDGRNYTNREYVEMRDRALRAEAKVERLTSNCRALFDTLMEALEYVPGEIDAECRQIIEKIRADIYGEETTADDQR